MSTNGVPTRDAQLPSAQAETPNTRRPGRPSDVLWAAKTPELPRARCVVPERIVLALGGRLVLPLPLEEWCGKPPRRPPKDIAKVARKIGKRRARVCRLPPCSANPRALPLLKPNRMPQSRQ